MGRVLDNRKIVESIKTQVDKDPLINVKGSDLSIALQMDISVSLAQIADDLHMIRKEGVKTK